MEKKLRNLYVLNSEKKMILIIMPVTKICELDTTC